MSNLTNNPVDAVSRVLDLLPNRAPYTKAQIEQVTLELAAQQKSLKERMRRLQVEIDAVEDELEAVTLEIRVGLPYLNWHNAL